MGRAIWRAVWLVGAGVVAILGFSRLAGQDAPELIRHPYLYLDIAKLAPNQFTVEFENNQVRVLRGRLGPNAAAPLHDAWSGVIVALTETHVRFVRIDKRMQYVDLDPGHAHWAHADTHSIRNANDKTAEFLFIELKDRPRSR